MKKKKISIRQRFLRLFSKIAAPGVKKTIEQKEKADTVYWEDSTEMHQAIRGFPGWVNALIIEADENPNSFEDIWDYLSRFPLYERKIKNTKNLSKLKKYVKEHLDYAVDWGVFEEKDSRYYLTQKGDEMARHMKEMIPIFTGAVFSPNTVSAVTITVHIFLTAVKCGFGALFNSAGLLSRTESTTE
jgi:hypothetical protein